MFDKFEKLMKKIEEETDSIYSILTRKGYEKYYINAFVVAAPTYAAARIVDPLAMACVNRRCSAVWKLDICGVDITRHDIDKLITDIRKLIATLKYVDGSNVSVSMCVELDSIRESGLIDELKRINYGIVSIKKRENGIDAVLCKKITGGKSKKGSKCVIADTVASMLEDVARLTRRVFGPKLKLRKGSNR